MKHEKNQDLQNTFSPYGIDLEQFFHVFSKKIDYVEHQASFLKKNLSNFLKRNFKMNMHFL